MVPNGVDPPPARRRGDRSGEPVLGFLGRIHPVKALERLVDAAAILRARGLRFTVQLAGPTPDRRYREELEAQVARLQLVGIVRLLGELRDEAKSEFYERCRVFVLPSSTENFGNVVPEALSHGTPVVASRFTPWAELEDFGCGRWVSNTAPELAAAIEPYLRDAALASSEGERGRALVDRRYTWDAVARAMIRVYEEAIDMNARSSRLGDTTVSLR